MNGFRMMTALLLVAAALAGCTGETPQDPMDDDMGGNVTPPTNETPEGNETEQPPQFLECTQPPASNATAGDVLGYPEVVFTVKEPSGDDPCFGFVGPASVPAGWTAVTLNNTGATMHIMPMFYVGDHTLEEVEAVLQSDAAPPAWVEAVGGVGVATPFSSGTVLMDLEEGTYVLVCFIEGHHFQGMYRLLEVTAAEGEELAGPVEDLTIELVDFNFTVPENVTAGRQIVRFVNNGTELHEAPFLLMDEGTTLDELLQAIENPQGPPPGAGVGGINTLAPGQEAFAVVDFLEGRSYGLVCFVESAEHEGMPHLALGMKKEFTVSASE